MIEEIDTDALQTFLEAAATGKRAGGKSSSGERAALLLARQAPKISALMQDMDSNLKNGFLSLLLGLDWPDTRQMLLGRLPR